MGCQGPSLPCKDAMDTQAGQVLPGVTRDKEPTPVACLVRVEGRRPLGTCAGLLAACLYHEAAGLSGDWSSWGGSVPLWGMVLGAPGGGNGSPILLPSLHSRMLV